MLNPSTADEHVLDPTVKKCVKWAKQWGFGALDVCNIFAWRSTDPKLLYNLKDPVGPENDHWIQTYGDDGRDGRRRVGQARRAGKRRGESCRAHAGEAPSVLSGRE